jgi:Protein of unknown function (Hypoth_ymh)
MPPPSGGCEADHTGGLPAILNTGTRDLLLSNTVRDTLVSGEREAESALFAGAMGHCRNPVAHRDVTLAPQETARLIVIASHLLSIVERRAV